MGSGSAQQRDAPVRRHVEWDRVSDIKAASASTPGPVHRFRRQQWLDSQASSLAPLAGSLVQVVW